MASSVDMAELADRLDIPMMGFADVRMWDVDPVVSANVPAEGRPLSIMPEARTAIVIGMPVQQTVVQTAPSIYYRELYNTVNSLLDSTAQRIVNRLTMSGYKAVYITRDGYHGIRGLKKEPSAFFSNKHAAYLAGLGTFGINDVIITERFGPRVRFTTILTDMGAECGKPMEKQLCTRCMRCSKACPVSAIGTEIYPADKMDKVLCTDHHEELGSHGTSPCGRCIAVCPVGQDIVVPPVPEAVENIRRYRL